MEVGRIVEILCDYRQQQLAPNEIEVVPDLQIIRPVRRARRGRVRLPRACRGRHRRGGELRGMAARAALLPKRATADSQRSTRMRIEQLMSRDVQHCGPEDTRRFATARLCGRTTAVACLSAPVTGPAAVIGIITDRDICKAALFQGKPLSEPERQECDEPRRARMPSCRPTGARAERVMRETAGVGGCRVNVDERGAVAWHRLPCGSRASGRAGQRVSGCRKASRHIEITADARYDLHDGGSRPASQRPRDCSEACHDCVFIAFSLRFKVDARSNQSRTGLGQSPGERSRYIKQIACRRRAMIDLQLATKGDTVHRSRRLVRKMHHRKHGRRPKRESAMSKGTCAKARRVCCAASVLATALSPRLCRLSRRRSRRR